MEVLPGVVKEGNFRHAENSAAPSKPPYGALLRSVKHTICDPFEGRQIVVLVGVVFVVVAVPIVAVHCAAGLSSLGPAHNWGVLIENGCLL